MDVQNAVIGLQQARARYDAAVKARVLQQQTLDGDQKKYRLGASTVFQVVQDQRDLATAGSAEVQALANYSHARIAFDQALGATLEVNHISLDEALSGQRRTAVHTSRNPPGGEAMTIASAHCASAVAVVACATRVRSRWPWLKRLPSSPSGPRRPSLSGPISRRRFRRSAWRTPDGCAIWFAPARFI